MNAARAASRKLYRVAIDIVPRMPPNKWTCLSILPWARLEKALKREVIEYYHAGVSHLGEKVIQVRPRACLQSKPRWLQHRVICITRYKSVHWRQA